MWKLRPYDKKVEKELLKLGKTKLVARLLSQRNIPSDKIDSFLSSDYKFLPHPHTLNGIKEASDIFCQVALSKGSVSVFGDYDCDGVVGSVMIKELCNVFGLDCRIFIPLRLEHGYGLNNLSLEAFKKSISTPSDLLIILDCGSNNENEIQDLRKFGFEKIIIIDHHIIDAKKVSKSADSFINWHLSDYEETCACGEIFQFIRGIRWLTKKVNPIEFLTYAAIGIVGDVSPLNVSNKIMVKNGLKPYSINHVVGSGLQALIKESGIYGDEISQEDISFKIVPKINACGRMADPILAFNLLVEREQVKAEEKAEEIQAYNNERKSIQKTIECEATNIVKNNDGLYKHGIALYNSKWPIGILGIAASRIAEKFSKPCILMGNNKGLIKGSGRSIDKINIKNILDECKDVLAGYGGHAYAVGLTLRSENSDEFNKIFNDSCLRYYEQNGYPEDVEYYDVDIPAKCVSTKMIQFLIDNFYPYCKQNNPQPIFKVSDIKISSVELREGDSWKLLLFNAKKDTFEIPFKFKSFSLNRGTEINDLSADIYFTFPQNTERKELYAIDIIFKK